MFRLKLIFATIFLAFLGMACKPTSGPAPAVEFRHEVIEPTRSEDRAGESPSDTLANTKFQSRESTPENDPQPKPIPTATLQPTRTGEGRSSQKAGSNDPHISSILGPDAFPQGISPLTGLSVADPSALSLPPALISVTNFPISARPQAGLSFSPYVFELYIGEGMTRFLAMFHGEYPVAPQASSGSALTPSDPASVGPIRSGRLPYSGLRKLYNGFLVMASASAEVRGELGGATNIFGSDSDDINSALIDVTSLQSIAQAQARKQPNLTGNMFSPAAPPGGKEASRAWVFYSWLNQVLWIYDPASGAYLRQQDNADGSGEWTLATDRINGEPLAFENVIVLFAQHHALNRAGTLIDVDLLYTTHYAYLFRDGRVYPIRWTTVNGEYEKKTGLLRPIRFTDERGNPVPLKPGSTWVEIVDVTTTLQELDPGSWKYRFYAPQAP
jgi:hypothetical protein